MDIVLIFLAIAVFIVAMALFLSSVFRKTIHDDERLNDPNGKNRDGETIATWVGIDDERDH